MGLGRTLKKAVGKVSKAVGGNAYASTFKAEAAKKQAKAEAAEKERLPNMTKKLRPLRKILKRKKAQEAKIL